MEKCKHRGGHSCFLSAISRIACSQNGSAIANKPLKNKILKIVRKISENVLSVHLAFSVGPMQVKHPFPLIQYSTGRPPRDEAVG